MQISRGRLKSAPAGSPAQSQADPPLSPAPRRPHRKSKPVPGSVVVEKLPVAELRCALAAEARQAGAPTNPRPASPGPASLAHAGPGAGTAPSPAGRAAMSQAELSAPCAAPSQRVFQEAVRKGNTAELHSLLQNMSSCEFNVNSFGPEGQTALHQSVIDGNLELVKLLVKFGADIRLANRDGWSALHIAAFGGHQDIVLYLITKAKYSAAGGGSAGGGGSRG